MTSTIELCRTTLTIAAIVSASSVIAPSVRIISTKYLSCDRSALAASANRIVSRITGAKFVGPYNCTAVSVRAYAAKMPGMPAQNGLLSSPVYPSQMTHNIPHNIRPYK